MYTSSESLQSYPLLASLPDGSQVKSFRAPASGLIGDLMIGVAGAFIGGWLLPQLGIHLGTGTIPVIIDATIGAVILLLIMRLVRGGNGWRARLGRGWNKRW